MYFVYILQSIKTKRYYIGSTQHLEKRLLEHNTGINKSTRSKGPYEIVYKEIFHSKE